MAEFLTTNGISLHLEQIIMEAKTNLFLFSPYLQISNPFLERLLDASKRKVSIKIIYRKNALKFAEQEKLELITMLRLYVSHNLHAKCYFNETKMIIGSLNLYEYSEKNNREMGVLINREIDKDLYTQAAVESLSIINSSTFEPSNYSRDRKLDHKAPNIKKFLQTTPGYCIRCTTRIDYNPARPLCDNCYKVWAQYNNYTFIENACHRCGEEDFITYGLPQCPQCFDEYKQKILK
jgi:hypothetical protein